MNTVASDRTAPGCCSRGRFTQHHKIAGRLICQDSSVKTRSGDDHSDYVESLDSSSSRFIDPSLRRHYTGPIMTQTSDVDVRDMGSITIELDHALAIRSVDHAWDLRADSFGAIECTSRFVTGTSILTFITGGTTRYFYERLYRWVIDTGQTVRLPYRCDAPDRTRHMEALIERVPEGLRCVHTTLCVSPRPATLPRLAFASTAPLTIVPFCSICMSVSWQNRWMNLQNACEAGLQLGPSALPVACTVCLSCSHLRKRLTSGPLADHSVSP